MWGKQKEPGQHLLSRQAEIAMAFVFQCAWAHCGRPAKRVGGSGATEEACINIEYSHCGLQEEKSLMWLLSHSRMCPMDTTNDSSYGHC